MRHLRILQLTAVFTLCWTSFAASSSQQKIVFVIADPNVGVASMRSLIDADPKSGSMTGSHAAPDMQATAMANAKRSRIALVNGDGSGLSDLHVYGTDPAISPDGAKIAYCALRDTVYFQIFVMNVDGSGQKRLTNFATGDACGPAWSHDGEKIAFHAFAKSNPRREPELWVMDADGSDQKRLTDHANDPAWSPTDKQIAFASKRDGNFQIYVINADGSGLKRLTNHGGEDSNPAWSPDGGAIVFSSTSEGDRRGLFLMGADGSQMHGLAHSKHQDFCFPAWSLDGQYIAFTALNRLGPQGIVVGEERPRCEMWSGEYQIFTMDTDGKIRQLTDSKLNGMRASYGRAAAPK